MPSITREQLHRWKAEGRDFALVNVLPPETFHERHIPGSVNVPGNDPQFAEKAAQVVHDPNRPVVVYCANLQCQASPHAATALEQAGFTQVYDYEAGMADWEAAGLPVDGLAMSRS